LETPEKIFSYLEDNSYMHEIGNADIKQEWSDETGEWVRFYLITKDDGLIQDISFLSSEHNVVKATATYLCQKWKGQQLKKLKSLIVTKYIDRDKVLEDLGNPSKDFHPYVELAIKTLEHCFDIWQWKKAATSNLMVKTGLFYNFKKTILFFWIFYILMWGCWVLSDIELWLDVFSLTFVIQTIGAFLSIIATIFLVRGTRDGVRKITFEKPDDFRNLFCHDYYFDKYRYELDRRINSTRCKYLGLILMGIIEIFHILDFIPHIYTSFIKQDWLAVIGFITNIIWWVVFYFFIFIVVYQVLIVIITIAQLGTHVKQLSITPFLKLDFEKLTKINTDDMVTYLQFHRYTRIFGEFLFKFTLKVIIFIVCMDLAFMHMGGIIVSLLMFGTFFCVSIFILPQFSIHNILKKTKNKIIIFYEDLYDKIKLEIFKIYASEKKEGLQDKISQVEFIKAEIKFTDDLGTWAYDFPKVMRLVYAACLSFIPLVIEIFI